MKEIYVFGSNLAGKHGKGSALYAKAKYGAEYGVGRGRTGDAYAIPTKDFNLKVLPLSVIKTHVDNFIDYARAHRDFKFIVVKVGCGLAGYSSEEIAPMFAKFPINCTLDEEWKKIISNHKTLF